MRHGWIVGGIALIALGCKDEKQQVPAGKARSLDTKRTGVGEAIIDTDDSFVGSVEQVGEDEQKEVPMGEGSRVGATKTEVINVPEKIIGESLGKPVEQVERSSVAKKIPKDSSSRERIGKITAEKFRENVEKCKAEVKEAIAELEGSIAKCGRVDIEGLLIDFASPVPRALVRPENLRAWIKHGNDDEFCISREMTRAMSHHWVPEEATESGLQAPCQHLFYMFRLLNVPQLKPVDEERDLWEGRRGEIFRNLAIILRDIRFSHSLGVSPFLTFSGSGDTFAIDPIRFLWYEDVRKQSLNYLEAKGGLENVVHYIKARAFSWGDTFEAYVRSRIIQKHDPLILFLDAVARFDFIGGEERFDFDKWISVFEGLAEGRSATDLPPIELNVPAEAKSWWAKRDKCYSNHAVVVTEKLCVNLSEKCGTGTQLTTQTNTRNVVIGDPQPPLDLPDYGPTIFNTDARGVFLKVPWGSQGSSCESEMHRHCNELTAWDILGSLEGKVSKLKSFSKEVCEKITILRDNGRGLNANEWIQAHKEDPRNILNYLVIGLRTIEAIHSKGFAIVGVRPSNVWIDGHKARLSDASSLRPLVSADGQPVIWDDRLAVMKMDIETLLNGVGALIPRSGHIEMFYRRIARLGLFEVPNYNELTSLLAKALKELNQR